MRVAREMSHSLCIVLLLLTCGALSAQNEEHRIRNIVLVHGAWADGSGWNGAICCSFGVRRGPPARCWRE